VPKKNCGRKKKKLDERRLLTKTTIFHHTLRDS